MNIYLISQNTNNGYDTYDSAVVVAKTEAEARLITPSSFIYDTKDENGVFDSSTWCNPDEVEVKLIGKAINQKKGLYWLHLMPDNYG